MRRFFFTVSIGLLGLYLGLHLALGSSPVQRRVLKEIQAALASYGLSLEMESIEFSAFSPKIYLNRVKLTATKDSPIKLPEPLAIDKIKLQFRPLALIYRQILVEELTLFHPRISLPSADRLFRKLSKVLSSKKAPRVESGGFSLVFRKVGVVDALFNVVSQDPPFAVRTRSFTAFLLNNANEQQSVTIESTNLELERGPVQIVLKRVDIDVDVTSKSLRVNRAILESDELALNVKGVSSLPLGADSLPTSASASYEVQISLPLLNRIQEVKLPKLAGTFGSSGTIRTSAAGVEGNGSARYEGVSVMGYATGSGNFNYVLEPKKLLVSQAAFQYAGGEVKSSALSLSLVDRFALGGEVQLKNVALEGILESVKVSGVPVRTRIDGKAKVSGTLKDPFELKLDVDAAYRDLYVLDFNDKPVSEENTIVKVKGGELVGPIAFTKDRMTFDAQMGGLGGEFKVVGTVGFDETAHVQISGTDASLTELGRIAELRLGGVAEVTAEIDVKGTDAKISGTFDAEDGEVGGIVLGAVKGEVFYQNDLLSFENLELPSLEPIRGNGYVDFKPKHTRYKFYVDARRAETNQIFQAFQKRKLGFPPPVNGEVAARLTLEGGHDDRGLEVIASGQAKSIRWYDESWMTGTFSISYREDDIKIDRVRLLKKGGALDIEGGFLGKKGSLTFTSNALPLEEIDAIGRSPITGVLDGTVKWSGENGDYFRRGEGEMKLTRVTFRGAPLGDSQVRVSTPEGRLEFSGRIAGERLRGSFRKGLTGTKESELLLYFQQFDFAPIASMYSGKDLPSLSSLMATGDIALSGDFFDPRSLTGSGSVTSLDIGLKGAPMRNRQAIQIKVNEGGFDFERFQLDGNDAQVSMDIHYQPREKIEASVDAKLDLQFLQPFIPGLDFGTGKVTAGLRVSGPPDRFEMLGNVTLEDGVLRLTGLQDELGGVKAQLSVSHDRINVDRFESTVNGGTLGISGDVRINRFQTLAPNLKLQADRIGLNFGDYLTTRLSGSFALKGSEQPYDFGGRCDLHEGSLKRFTAGDPLAAARLQDKKPVLTFDVRCEAKERLFVQTDIMDAEFRGNFHLLGNENKIGLLGTADALRGSVLFRETRFTLNVGTVKFESATEIAPRFNVSGRSTVREQSKSTETPTDSNLQRGEQYEITLVALGTPQDYRIRLSSSPALAENDIISLLLLGVTSRSADGNYVDLGTTIAGQIPLQSKIQSELGVDIKIRTQQQVQQQDVSTGPSSSSAATRVGGTVPSVQIRKDITKKTKLSYSNTLETVPVSEFKIEQMLDDNLTVNATVERSQGAAQTQPGQSYGLDFRYRFSFE